MHIHFLDPYQSRQSPIHELDPRVKFILTVAFILTVSLSPPGAWPVYVLLLAIILSVEMLSDLGIAYVLKRANLALPFALAAIPLLFTVTGDPLHTFELGPWMLTITGSGLERFISVILKSWISVQAAIVLAASTPFPELLMAMRAVRIPRLLVAIFGLTWRYLFVLVDEALRLLRARAARSGHAKEPDMKAGGSITWRARVAGQMAGSLFIRALERSDRIYMAMVSRGYDGEVRSLPLPGITAAHWFVLIASLGLLGFLLASTYLFW